MDAFSHSVLRHARPFTLQIMVTPSVSSAQSILGSNIRPVLKIVECVVVDIDADKQIVTLGMNKVMDETDFALDLDTSTKLHKRNSQRKQIRPDILTQDLVVELNMDEVHYSLPRHEFRLSALLHCNLPRMPNYVSERDRFSLHNLCNPVSPTFINTDKTYTLFDTIEHDNSPITSFENTFTSLEMEFPYSITLRPELSLSLQPITFSYSYLFPFLVSKPHVYISNIIPLRGKERLVSLKSALTTSGMIWRESFWTYEIVLEYLLTRQEMGLEEVVKYLKMIEGVVRRG